MKKLATMALATMVFWCVNAAESDWLTDLPKAQAQAKTENKVVLIDFSGSDWCPDCIALKKRVFDTQEFQTFAATNVVLVDLDFPDKKPQPDDVKKANAKLKDQYQVEGFPTLVVLDANGKEIGRLHSGDADSPKALIAALGKIQAEKMGK